MISARALRLLRGNTLVADQFSINIEPGKIHALIGPNGCGKSTALAALAGDRTLYSGAIQVDGVDQKQMSIEQMAKKRAVVSQSQKFLLGFRVGEVLEMAIRVSGSRADIALSVAELNIEALLNRKTTSLSGGEQQRVSIAMALSQATPYLLLDEPFSAQDVESVERIVGYLQKLSDKGKGILLVAHMAEADLDWCDDITRLHKVD